MSDFSQAHVSRQFGVLAKYWLPGQVKTRLALCFGEKKAATLHHLFLTTTLRRFASVPARRVLSFSPDCCRAEFEALAKEDWTLLPQTGGDLGGRITDYFQEAFANGSKRVLLIAADTPHLPQATVTAAFDALIENDLVFVPSDDGGYCLVGASRPVDPLMVDIEWGGQKVWEQTQKKIKQLQWSAFELPAWYDIDRQEDLERLLNELAEGTGEDCESSEPYLAMLYRQIAKICGPLTRQK